MNQSNERLSDTEVARRGTRGVVTYVTRNGLGQLIQAVSALAVARILSPRSYGIFALALTLLGFVRLFGDLGITLSLTVEREINERDLRGGCAVALAVAVVGGVLISAIWTRLPMVQATGHGAVWIMPVLTLTLLAGVPAVPSTIMLERRLEFSRLGVIGVVTAVVLFSTQVSLLVSGFGLWAMVLAYTFGSSIGSVLTVLASRRLYLPSIKAPIKRLVGHGLPFQGAALAYGVTGTVTNLFIAVQLGAAGIGLFAWCTILATPLMGALSGMHNATAPTLAKMRRDDGTRYGESVGVMVRSVATVAAVGAGCLIGLAHPIIQYVFATRWLPATAAVQFCLAGTFPLAICVALQADANARIMRRLTLTSAVIGGAASLVALVPLALIAGVGGAAIAAFYVGPAVSAVILASELRSPIQSFIVSTLRLFVGLTVVSSVFGEIVIGPFELAAACIAIACVALAALYVSERALAFRIWRQLRRPPDVDPARDDRAPMAGETVRLELATTPHGVDNIV